MHRERQRGVARMIIWQALAVDGKACLELVRRVDQRRGENRQAPAGGERESIGAVGSDADRRVRLLQRPRHQGQVASVKIFAVERKGFAGPRREDEIERLVEPLAALLRRNAVMRVVPRDTASDAEFETAIAEDVGDRGFFGDLDRVVQRQQGHRRAEPDPLRPLRRRGQRHQRVGKYREGPDEVNLAEPDRIKAELVTQLYLRQDILIALMFGKSVGAGQLVEEPEAHALPLSPYRDSRVPGALARVSAYVFYEPWT